MQPGLERHFVTLRTSRWGPRQVHYLRAGSGPTLIAFHQSPLSCWDSLPLVRRWSRHFTVIAPDNPGFGLSSPFGLEEVSSDDMGHAAIEFMDALGIQRTGVYGVHTGAVVTATLVARYPERITAAVANGYIVQTQAERADYLAHYLPAYPPSWDGSHLAALWGRLRQTGYFFPWQHSDAAHRVSFTPPPLPLLERWLIEHLRSGDHYRVGYRTAFTANTAELLLKAGAPLLVTGSSEDVLSSHLERIKKTSRHVTVDRRVASEAETLQSSLDFLLKYPAPPMPTASTTSSLPGRPHQQMIPVRGGQLRARIHNRGKGTPLLFLHDAASSIDALSTLIEPHLGKRPIVALDLPGHGESDGILSARQISATNYARTALEALDTLDLRKVEIFGVGLGGCVALEMAELAAERIARVTVAEQPHFSNNERRKAIRVPRIAIQGHGGHISQAWHYLRERDFFSPEAVSVPVPGAETLTQGVLDLLRAPQRWPVVMRSYANYPIERRLDRSGVPVTLAARTPGPFASQTRREATRRGLKFQSLDSKIFA